MKLKVCLLALDSLPDDEREQGTLIDALPFGDAERERLRGIRNPAARAQSLGGWMALGELVKTEPISIPRTVLRAPSGKPHFESLALPDFNISHTRTLAVAILGQSDSGSVGIDIESERPSTDIPKIVARFFTDAEQKEMEACGMSSEAFFRLWTQKEARAKCSGRGLAAELSAPSHAYTQTYRVRYGDELAYLSVAATQPNFSIEWIHHIKELTYEQLPN